MLQTESTNRKLFAFNRDKLSASALSSKRHTASLERLSNYGSVSHASALAPKALNIDSRSMSLRKSQGFKTGINFSGELDLAKQ